MTSFYRGVEDAGHFDPVIPPCKDGHGAGSATVGRDGSAQPQKHDPLRPRSAVT
jgi:hypothetical protein